jgi:pantoate--beta-alanine ligase
VNPPRLISAIPDARWRLPDRAARLALVPTMGALHEGHVALIRAARERAERVVVSIFVNPLQFGPTEDLARYPRELEADLAICADAGVEAVFHPRPEEFYPPGFQTRIEVAEIAADLCGARRPGHFQGVATVVYRLFQLVQPNLALFGEKDFQQLRVVQRMVLDLGLPVDILPVPIVREADGLALSSRNRYLSPGERVQALSIIRGLREARAAFAAGERDPKALAERCRNAIGRGGLRQDYVELRDPETLRPLAGPADESSRLLVAAFAGSTRLIDNVRLG